MKSIKVLSLLMIALLSISPLWADDTNPIPTTEEKSDPPSKRSSSNSLILITYENGVIEISFLQEMGIVRCDVLNHTTFELLTSVIDTQVGTEFIKLPDTTNSYIIVLRTISGEYITSSRVY